MTFHDRNAIDRLDAYLDAVAAGRSVPVDDATAEWRAIDRRFRSLDRAPEPPTAFAGRLLEDLTHATAQPSNPLFALNLTTARNGRLPNWPSSRPKPRSEPSRTSWAVAQLATAALLVVTLVAGFFAFGPGRPERREDTPAFLPALSGTPAAPEAGGGPIAEVIWQASGGPDLPFLEPGQPAVDPQGNLWVPDSGYGQFLIFAPDGTFLEAWGTPGSNAGAFRFADPMIPGYAFGGVAWDGDGNIYVADTGNHRIQKFDPDRAFVTSWGSEGSGEGQFRRPIALAVDERGRVYVSDEGWGRIEVFTTAGEWLATWTGLATPTGIAVAGNGTIWVADFGGGVVQFSAAGERLAIWSDADAGGGVEREVKSVAVDAVGRVYLADLAGNQVHVFSPDGSSLGAWGERGAAAGQFQEPYGIALDGEGAVYVTDYAGKRVQKFRLLPPLAPAIDPALSGTPAAPELIVRETLLEADVDDLPTGHGAVTLKRWTLPSGSRALDVPPLGGPWLAVVESGEIAAAEAGTEHRFGAGDVFAPADREQKVGLRVDGPEDATLLVVYLVNNLKGTFLFDPVAHRYVFLNRSVHRRAARGFGPAHRGTIDAAARKGPAAAGDRPSRLDRGRGGDAGLDLGGGPTSGPRDGRGRTDDPVRASLSLPDRGGHANDAAQHRERPAGPLPRDADAE